MVDVPVVLQSIGAAIGIAKAVAEAKGEWNRADLRLQMAEVTNTLADAKIALTEAQTELYAKDQEIERLKAAFARKDETVEFQGKYFRKGADGKPRGRAFCPVCWDAGRPFLLDRDKGMRGNMTCARCKSDFNSVGEFPDEPTA